MKQIIITQILLLLLPITTVHSQCANDLSSANPYYPGLWVGGLPPSQKQTCLTDINILSENNWLCNSVQFYPTLSSCCSEYYSASEQENCLNPGSGSGGGSPPKRAKWSRGRWWWWCDGGPGRRNKWRSTRSLRRGRPGPSEP